MDIRAKLFGNLGWKIGALALSLLLWFHIATEKTYEKTFDAKIEITRLGDSLEVQAVEPSAARISFIGTGKQLLQLMAAGGIKIQLNLSYISRPGEYESDITLSDLVGVDLAVFRSATLIDGDHLRIIVKPKT